MNNINWKYQDGEVDSFFINNVEKTIGLEFPSDYKECVKINQGGSPTLYLFEVNGVERVFGSLLKINNPNSSTDILNVYESYKDTLPKGVVPFGNDPAGNFICFDYKNNALQPIVVFWDHENAAEKEMLMEKEGLTEEQAEERARENVFYVAATFTEFLDKLHD